MARDLPGSAGNYISIPHNAAFSISGTALTLAAWVNPDGTGGGKVLAKLATTDTGGGYQIGVSAAPNKAYVGINDGTFPGESASGTTTLSAGTWYSIVGRKSGTGAGALRVFLNGVQDGSASSSLSIAANTQNLVFGRYSNSDTTMFDGKVAYGAVWNVALTDEEIAALGKGVSPLMIRPASLKGFWPLFGIGAPEPDLSENGNPATVNGSVPAAANHAPVGPLVPMPAGGGF